MTGLFVFAAAVIVASAEPFAESLISTGTQLGIDRFLLVQWVAPLASEAPEFIVAILFAVHGKGSDAIGTLISSKVSQWTLLVGSLPLAYLAGGGGTALVLDGRQVEEFLLTAGQTLLGVAALLTLRFPRWLAFTLLGLFAVQYAVPGQSGRYLLAAVYGAIALVALIRNRRNILPALAAPFRSLPGSSPALEPTVAFGPEIERIDRGRRAQRPAGGRQRRSRRLFPTTNTELNAIAAAAISGLRKPSAASGMAAAL